MWFSDTWDLKGVGQILKNTSTRERSAAFPFDLAYRLINMFSVYGDTILDPFLGTGTSMLAAMVSGRNSIGIEIEAGFRETIISKVNGVISLSNMQIKERLLNHTKFVENREASGGELKYLNHFYNFPVMTKQEIKLYFPKVKKITLLPENKFQIDYDEFP